MPNVLFDEFARISLQAAEPSFFRDLNLDQIVEITTEAFAEYDLKPFFWTPRHRPEAIRYRHDVFRDLEDERILSEVRTFAGDIREVRERLRKTEKLYYRLHKQAWFLKSVTFYGQAVKRFVVGLTAANPKSRGLNTLRNFVAEHVEDSRFTTVHDQADRLQAELSEVTYSVLIGDGEFTVRRYEDEPDYSIDVERTFWKFRQGAAKSYLLKWREADDMNHIEAKILEFVARLNPGLFQELDDFCGRNASFIDGTIAAYDREIHFYVAYLDYISKLKTAGLPFCYPAVSATSKKVYNDQGFDLALARKLVSENKQAVCNNFRLEGPERIVVVSGPNQGGKTTFARTFGQLHYLAKLGCPVPGRGAELFICDRLFTHFEREEKVESLRGKLQDDLLRAREILRQANSNSIIVMNEIFTSTTLHDETFLSRRLMRQIVDLGCFCIWVTFVDELASFGPETVSMVSTVDPQDPARRTFKIVRRPADGLAYAMAIAEKYGLTYRRIKERVRS